jgi:hypothetical protein
MTKEHGLTGVQATIAESAAPVARFVGHSAAIAVGFVLLTALLLIPIGIVKLLVYFGVKELSTVLEMLELGLLYGEIGFFVVTLVIGALELLLTETIRALGRIRQTWRDAFEND